MRSGMGVHVYGCVRVRVWIDSGTHALHLFCRETQAYKHFDSSLMVRSILSDYSFGCNDGVVFLQLRSGQVCMCGITIALVLVIVL